MKTAIGPRRSIEPGREWAVGALARRFSGAEIAPLFARKQQPRKVISLGANDGFALCKVRFPRKNIEMRNANAGVKLADAGKGGR